jgi:hypothetical protein
MGLGRQQSSWYTENKQNWASGIQLVLTAVEETLSKSEECIGQNHL